MHRGSQSGFHLSSCSIFFTQAYHPTPLFRDVPILLADFWKKYDVKIKAKSKMLEKWVKFGKIVAEGLELTVLCSMEKIETL